MKAPLLLLIMGWATVVADEMEIPWTYNVENGQTAELYCNDSKSSHMTEPGNTLKWMRNNMEIKILPDSAQMKYEFVEENGIKNAYLFVKDVQPEDYGEYYCHVYDHRDNNQFVMTKAINLSGPLYANLFDKYRENLIVAVIAGAVLLGLSLLLCFVYHFRYRESGDEHTYNVYDTDLSKTEHAFDNPVAYVYEDNEMSKSDIEMMEPSGANGYDGTTKM